MRAVVQRVTRASVTVGDEVVGAIGPGLCVLVGVTHDDDDAGAAKLADKLWHLRILDDDDGVMNVSAAEAGAPLLVISQFTLYGDTDKGRRPSWLAAARPSTPSRSSTVVAQRLRDAGRHGRHRPVPGRHGRRAGQRRPCHGAAGDLNDGSCLHHRPGYGRRRIHEDLGVED